MSGIAKVVVEIALGREFDYLIPGSLDSTVSLGSLVTVPFGRKIVRGYVVGLEDESKHPNLKAIASVVGNKPMVDEKILELARWMGDYYCASIEQSIRTVLPGAVRKKGAAFKERLFVQLVPGLDDEMKAKLQKKAPKQLAVLEVLEREKGMFLQRLAAKAGTTVATVRALEGKSLVMIATHSMNRDPLDGHVVVPSVPLELMEEQAKALDQIMAVASSGKPGTILLQGVTGSGKTEVYLQAIDQILKKGKGAIVLVPEISLTPQTVERFQGRFGNKIAVLHSHLSDGERHDQWHKIHDGEACIAIGARSAVFAPVKNLGLIVVDEEHEPTYKQEDAPRYNARDMAVMRGQLEKCPVVLGSATPSLESYWNSRCGKYELAVLSHRADHRKMPAMRVIDMRTEAIRQGHPSIFSQDLIEAVRSRLDRAEQTMLFLNRRGYATSLLCQKCGYVAKCGQCSVSFTYHRQVEALNCHICGSSKAVPNKCPSCGDKAFKFAGIGTQRIESIVSKLFPKASIQRMDADATTRKNSHRQILGDFRVGKTDILIGTQMIAKGLHFPNVTLIGVLYADLSLHMPDFRASERTFQLLTQVAGRAGRGDVKGEVIVQTYTPSHVAIQSARKMEYDQFCRRELEDRRELGYPPFGHLVCVTIKGLAQNKAAFYAEALARKVAPLISDRVVLAGPTPAPISRAKGYYRYQIMLRAPVTKLITGPLTEVLVDFKLPPKMSCSVDVDAISLL